MHQALDLRRLGRNGAVLFVAGALMFTTAAGLCAAPQAPPRLSPLEPTPAAFPLKVSPGGRHLVDERGTPFLYQADTCWKLFLKLTEAEAGEYLRARKAQGFNVIQMMLTGFNERGSAETNRAGQKPFVNDADFSQVNEAFFAHVDRVLAMARELDLALAIAPLWAGCCGEGWAGKDRNGRLKPMNANGPDKCREFGRWLGRRYAKFDHVMWILGGDNDPGESREVIRALALGLKEAAPAQLLTYHAASSHSSTDVWPNEPWLDVVMVYTYFRGFNKAWNKNQPDVYEVSYKEYAKTPIKPFFLGESTYEGEHDAWGSALQARKQAWWVMLSGGTGHAYGSPNWNVPAKWREVIQSPGARSLGWLPALLRRLPWHTLMPDVANQVAVDGRGAYATNNYATTSVAADGTFAVSYLPTPRTLSINLERLSGPTHAAWYDPTDGRLIPIEGSPFAKGGIRQFSPQERNGAGDPDAVLVLATPEIWKKLTQ